MNDSHKYNPASIERPVLYYPYIHIRSEDWLKATLLCMPVVKRIVPENYVPEDDAIIQSYTKIQGPFGPLLQSVPAWSPAAHEAQNRLLDFLIKNAEQITTKFSREKAPIPDAYWIHDAKFTDELLCFLRERRLAWRSEHSKAYGKRNWFALHPQLGSAVMSTLGLSIAREQRYDIVTDSGEFHETLIGASEDEVFSALLRAGAEPTLTRDQVRRDLGQLVITLTGLNYRALPAESIPELQASASFTRFQQLIRTRAHAIDLEKPDVYKAQLKSTGDEIIEAWQNASGTLSKEVKAATTERITDFAAEATKALMHNLVAEDTVTGAGIVIGVVRAGIRSFQQHRRPAPHRYLTQVVEAQDRFLRLMFPLGLNR